MPMQSAAQQSRFLFALIAVISVVFSLGACAPDRNRKDRLSRVQAGGTNKANRTGADVDNQKDKDADPRQTKPAPGKSKPDGNGDKDQQPTPDKADDDKAAGEEPAPTNAVCKLTDASIEGLADAAATDASLAQCARIDVQTDATGEIKFINRYGTEANLKPYEIKNGEFTVDATKDNLVKMVIVSSSPSAMAKNNITNANLLDELIISYQLPHTADEIALDKEFNRGLFVTENGTTTELKEITFVQNRVGSNLIITITNPEKIKNINFSLVIEYHLSR